MDSFPNIQTYFSQKKIFSLILLYDNQNKKYDYFFFFENNERIGTVVK